MLYWSSVVTSCTSTSTLRENDSNLLEAFNFCYWYFYNFEGRWLESSINKLIIYTVQKPRQAVLLWYTYTSPPPLYYYLEDSNYVGAISLDLYKLVNISKKSFYIFKDIWTSSLQSECQDATTELTDYVNKLSNTTLLYKTYVNVILARPTFIIRLLHNLCGRSFSQKKQWRQFALASVFILIMWRQQAAIITRI